MSWDQLYLEKKFWKLVSGRSLVFQSFEFFAPQKSMEFKIILFVFLNPFLHLGLYHLLEWINLQNEDDL